MGLIIKNITKSFDGSVIINDLSFSFDDHGVYLIKGASGVGKTTLLRIISGLDGDFSGIVEGGGIKNSAFMFQEHRLFPTLSALENAAISIDKYDHEKKACAEKMLIFLGFKQDDLNKKTEKLSGGMKQRVSFVRAVMKNTPILLLDEPTKELNSELAKAMMDIIDQESQKRLVLLVSHESINEYLNTKATIEL